MNPRKLIDTYLPEYTFNEYHDIIVNGEPETVYRAATQVDLSRSRLTMLLFKLRGLPTRRMNFREFLEDMGFTVLKENAPQEILIGFWMRWKIAPIGSCEDFVSNALGARIKVVWNFYLEELEPGKVRLSTETRVLCMGPLTRLTFGLYWLLIKPFSGLIRKEMLKIIKEALRIRFQA